MPEPRQDRRQAGGGRAKAAPEQRESAPQRKRVLGGQKAGDQQAVDQRGAGADAVRPAASSRARSSRLVASGAGIDEGGGAAAPPSPAAAAEHGGVARLPAGARRARPARRRGGSRSDRAGSRCRCARPRRGGRTPGSRRAWPARRRRGRGAACGAGGRGRTGWSPAGTIPASRPAPPSAVSSTRQSAPVER